MTPYSGYIEWGVLYSASSQGKQRYPEYVKAREFIKNKYLQTSLHLCGRVVRDLISEGKFVKCNEPAFLIENAHRVQLNFNHKRTPVDLLKLFSGISRYMHQPTILQVNQANQELIDAVAKFTSPESFHYLFDASGGRGTEIEEIPQPIEGKYCGYAGGLNPDNLKEKLELLNKSLPEDAVIWIDMESGVRTNNEFDLDKVRKCFDIVKPYFLK